MALVGDDIGLVADEGHDTAQKQVHLAEFRQSLQGPPAHETVIRMVEHDFHAHGLHDLVEALGCEFFKEGVGIPGASDAVYHIISLVVFLHHLVDDVHVILQIGVQRNGHIRFLFCRHKPSQQRVLMALIPGQLDAGIDGVRLV